MSLESAQKFVSKMKEDKEFRSTVQQAADTVALNDYLRGQGFEFNQRELVGAMASCMAELDKMAQGCCQ
ncbi:MAG: Nif11-like leader peptide family natural product precursor [Deltaproteobacteria bacterium]|nr:Nif11-like leader peptide family natural product precursor [Deltaproteobacteria bacterium]